MCKYYCLIIYMLLFNDILLVHGQERKETATYFEESAEDHFKKMAVADSNESPGPLITGVDALKLFESVVPGYKQDPNSRRSIIHISGVHYLLKKKDSADKASLPVSYSVGVFENREKAITAFARELRMMSIGPEPLIGLGDRAYYGTSPNNKSTTIRFRRKNVVVILGIDLPGEDAINIAKKIDNELENNSTVVTRGDKVTPPYIEIKNLPESIELKKSVDLIFDLKDTDPNEIFMDSDSNSVYVTVDTRKRPKVVYYAPVTEEEIGQKTFILFVANQKNVVTYKEYELSVTANGK
jgi:hypothetical protein